MSYWDLNSFNEGIEPRKLSAIDSVFRHMFCKALDSVQQGEITLIENGSQVQLGQKDDAGLGVQIKVHDSRFYRLAVTGYSLGVAEAYRRGYWEADNLTTLIRIFVRRRGQESFVEKLVSRITTIPRYLIHQLRRNNRSNSKRNIEAHYNLGNDFFELFLDKSLTYSCGVFESPGVSMEEASNAKLRRICEKLQLRPGMSIVEIGSGWGSFAIFAAKEYGCKVTSVTLSSEQCLEANRRISEAGIGHLAEVRLMDYRDIEGKFDRLVSIEMIEAIGHFRMREYFKKCSSLLKPEGLMAIQAITMPDQGYQEYLRKTDFIQQYIFPGSNCPARSAILEAASEASDLRAISMEEIGAHYATTLSLWREQFVKAIPSVIGLGYSIEFIRLWHYYLCYCEGGFAEHYIGTVQLVFSKPMFRDDMNLPFNYSLRDQSHQSVTGRRNT